MRSRLAQRDRNGCGFQKCLLELDCGGDSCKKVAKIGAPLRGGASLWELTREMGARRFVDDRFVARAQRRHKFGATAGRGREGSTLRGRRVVRNPKRRLRKPPRLGTRSWERCSTR